MRLQTLIAHLSEHDNKDAEVVVMIDHVDFQGIELSRDGMFRFDIDRFGPTSLPTDDNPKPAFGFVLKKRSD